MRGREVRVAVDCTAAIRQGAGIGRYTRELVRALLAQERLVPADSHGQFAINYILMAATGGLPDAARRREAIAPEAAGLARWRSLPVSDRALNIIWQRLRIPLPAELVAGRPDVFHSPDFTLPPLARARSVLTVHDLSFLRHPESTHPQQRAYLAAAVPRSAARADHILADSECTRADIIDLLGVPKERVSVVYPGLEWHFQRIEDAAVLAIVRQRYRLPDRYILFVGTLQPRKNLVRLIRAFGRLVREPSPAGVAGETGADLKLVLIGGKGWLYEEIFETVEKLNLADRVVFPGYVDDADLPAIYSQAALLALPSLYEGFGLPVVEAMACGCPVITSNTSSLPEAAGDAALLVSPTDEEALAEAMRRVLADDGLRSRLAAAGHAQARRFTWEAAARQTRAVYESLASGLLA